MPVIIQFDSVAKNIGALTLFEEVSFDIGKGDKVALLGINGSGKSTLLDIISGKESFSHGSVNTQKGISMAYLEQEPVLNENKTIIDAIFESGNELLGPIKRYEEALLSGDLKQIEEASGEMDRLRLWDFETRIKQILSKLNLVSFHQKLSELSGGQKKRVALANVLLSEPDFLILDEPTNHLDLEVIEWLEQYLARSSLTLLMVTHDRYFLDRICTKILEIDNRQIYTYEGNYSGFVSAREKRITLEQLEVDKAQNMLRKEEDWMKRMPKARRTKAKYRIENYYRIKEISSKERNERQISLATKETRMGSKVLEVKNIDFAWNGDYYIKNFSYTFKRREKIGILGKNGIGKSTLIELLTGKLKPEKGTIETGITIKIGYYRQEGIQFDETMKVIDAVRKIAETVAVAEGSTITVSQFLQYFLFPYSRQHDYIYKLSGGEKRRLYLCQVLMQNPNFLVLDEPTNDLDIASLQVLEDYLADFNGCVLIVSHDRFFMDSIIDHMFVFCGDARIKDFPGNYSAYSDWLKEQEKPESVPVVRQKKDQPISRHGKNKLTFREKKELEQLEKEIEQLEVMKKSIEDKLSSGSLSQEELHGNSIKISKIIQEIEIKSERWIELSEKVG